MTVHLCPWSSVMIREAISSVRFRFQQMWPSDGQTLEEVDLVAVLVGPAKQLLLLFAQSLRRAD